ncbi:ankyrin, partial [Choiromyces venosus 120613-1]
TPLLHAVSAGRTDIVKLLLAYEGEVDVNYMDPYGNTGLSISASLGNLEIVQDLLAHPKIAYPHGASLARHPLHLAVESGSLDVFRLLLSHTAPDSDGSVDVNVVSWAHRTPLLVAAEHGREGIVKFLLGYPHLDVNFVVHGWSALHMAVNNGRESVVRLLVDEPRTNLNLGDLDGWTPLHMAARPGHVEIVKILLAK